MKVVICDDELIARERLAKLVEDAGHEIVGLANNGQQALDLVTEHKPDVVFLDVRMPTMDGIECAYAVNLLDHPPAIVFVTAFDEHALEAFKHQAIAYLLKPVNRIDLGMALDRAQKLTIGQLSQLSKLSDPTNEGRKHIAAKTHRGVELIPVDSIYYFLADQKYVTVKHAKGEVLIDDTLKELEGEFAQHFIRIHRNALLSLSYLEALEVVGAGQYQVKIKGIDDRLVVSRRHLPVLREKIMKM